MSQYKTMKNILLESKQMKEKLSKQEENSQLRVENNSLKKRLKN